MAETKDQVEVTQPSGNDKGGSTPKTAQEGYDKAGALWDEIEMIQESVSKKEDKPKVEAEAAEEECVGCTEAEAAEKARAKKTEVKKETYPKELKIGGETFTVNNKKELAEKIAEFYDDDEKMVDLAQMSGDYTRKRQADSGKMKTLEEEYRGKVDELSELAKAIKPGERPAAETRPTVKPPSDAEIKEKWYEHFEIDKEFASDKEIKMVDTLLAVTKANVDLQGNVNTVMAKQDLYDLERTGAEARTAMDKAQKEFPIEKVTDEKGNNLTYQQYEKLFTARVKDPANARRPIPELAVEAWKDMYLIQKRGKEVATPEVTNKMSREEFKKTYPDLFKRVVDPEREDAVVESDEERAKLPPSIESTRRDIESSKKKKGKGEITTVEQGLKEGFAALELES